MGTMGCWVEITSLVSEGISCSLRFIFEKNWGSGSFSSAFKLGVRGEVITLFCQPCKVQDSGKCTNGRISEASEMLHNNTRFQRKKVLRQKNKLYSRVPASSNAAACSKWEKTIPVTVLREASDGRGHLLSFFNGF